MKKPIIKTAKQIENIRTAGQHLTTLLKMLQSKTKAGIQLIELENIAEQYIQKHKLKGAFKGYHGFPANLCLSLNDCIVHGIPDKKILKNGDLLKIDCGIEHKSNIADAAISIVVGGEQTNPHGEALIDATKTGLDKALTKILPDEPIHNYSQEIFSHITEKEFSIIKSLTGHGVGVSVHEPPYIYNRPHPETQKHFFKENMIVAVEPITAINSEDFIEDPDNGRNLYTKNGDLGAQREYTILITQNGPEILAGIQ